MLEQARAARESVRAELTSLEALQAAALNDHAGETAAWLTQSGLSGRPRLAATLEVEPGWERAVETVLGDYLEAVCVEELEAVSGALEHLATGRVTLIEKAGAPGAAEAGTLAARVRGSAALRALLSAVLTADSLAQALSARAALRPGNSWITPRGRVGRARLAAREPRHRPARRACSSASIA